MTTWKRMTLGLAAAGALVMATACGGNGNNNNGTSDMAMHHTVTPTPDMAPPGCVMNPTTSTELLNACTTATTGDPKKDYPYFPSQAPNGNLPPLP
jgi:hypothetical protein